MERSISSRGDVRSEPVSRVRAGGSAARAADASDRETSEDRYRAICEVVSDWAYSLLVHPDGRWCVSWTDLDAPRITGYEESELELVSGWLGLAHPDDRSAVRRHIAALVAGRTDIAEYRIVTRSGEVRWVRDYARPLEPDGSGAIRVVGGVRDVTVRRQAEADRARLISELEATNEELERIALSVSRELIGPLETVAGSLQMLEGRLPAETRSSLRPGLEQATAAVQHLRGMLMSLDELARIGHLPETLEAVSLGDLARQAVDLCREGVATRNVRVEIGELPQVLGDRIRLLQLLRILVENAIQYAGGQSPPRLEIGAERRGGRYLIHVRDNGAGIDPGDLERVFDVFHRGDPRGAGTGVGLALARRIAEMHGGRIWAESEGRGHGSTFRIELPA